MSGHSEDDKKIDVDIQRYLLCEEKKQTNISPLISGSQQLKNDPNNLFYQKIKPIKPEQLDIEAIIAEYNMSVDSKNIIQPQKIEKKQKLKIPIKKLSKEPKKVSIVPKMIINQESTQLINSFKKILSQKFNGFNSELIKQRRTYLQRLFSYLCFGFQQILQSFKADSSSTNILSSINKEDILMLLKQRAFAIDLEILNSHKNIKRSVPSLKFKNQWKHILDLLKQPGNSKLRQAIIIDQVSSSFIVYAREIDLIKYLSTERQNKLKFEAEYILKNSQSGNQWILHHSQTENQHNQQDKSSLLTGSQLESDHDSSTSTFQNDSIEQPKSNLGKSKNHKGKKPQRNKQVQLIDLKGMRKIRKTDQNNNK